MRSAELIEEPQPMLRVRQRVARGGGRRRNRLAPGALRRGRGQLGERRIRQQRFHADRQAVAMPRAVDEPRCRQAVAAQIEETVVNADRVDAEDLAPERGELPLDRGSRRAP